MLTCNVGGCFPIVSVAFFVVSFLVFLAFAPPFSSPRENEEEEEEEDAALFLPFLLFLFLQLSMFDDLPPFSLFFGDFSRLFVVAPFTSPLFFSSFLVVVVVVATADAAVFFNTS